VGRSKKQKQKALNPSAQTNISGIHKSSLFRDLNFWFGLIGVVGTIIGIVGLWFYFKDKEETTLNKNKAAMSGILRSTNDVSNTTAPIISAGGARFIIWDPNGVFLSEGTNPLVWLHINNGKLAVSANIRNENGELVAELRDNEWTLNKNLIFDRNYTNQALEVRERSGKVILQVAILPVENLGEIIYFAGILRCSNGRTLEIANGQTGAVFEFQPPHKPSQITINPIFKYPSDLHFGDCPGYKTLLSENPAITNGKTHVYWLSKPLDICDP
jgi:hypothetical protein